MRIGIQNVGGPEWTGGRAYVINLLSALRSLPDAERPEIVQLSGGEPLCNSAGSRLVDDFVNLQDGSGRTLSDKLRNRFHAATAHRFEGESWISRWYRKHGVDVVFAIGNIGANLRIPLMGWIPDFQHFRLPEMFSPEEAAGRNEAFRATGNLAQRVILSSQDALKDYALFQPEQKHKGSVLSFVAQVPTMNYDMNPSYVCERYHLPEKFFYLPNQLWKHKNHQLVIKALGLVKSRQPEIMVVCTGQAYDSRHPDHMGQLLLNASREGVHSQLRFLGLIPLTDIVPMIRQSIAVLQPSLFEGWSTTIEESKSVGKRVLLSDIPVHCEQSPEQGKYFNPHSAGDLADLLVETYNTVQPGPDLEMEAAARAALSERTWVYGRRFMEIAREAVA